MHWVDELGLAIVLIHHHEQSGIRNKIKFLRLYFTVSYRRWLIDQLQKIEDSQ